MSQTPLPFPLPLPALATALLLSALPGCKQDSAPTAPAAAQPAQVAPVTLRVVDATGASVDIQDASRLVTIGGTVTEIVYALGAGEAVKGVDSSSLFPAEARRLPQVGYQRRLSAEGVLALEPTLVLMTEESGPPPAVAQLRASGAPVVVVPVKHSVESARASIRLVGEALDRRERASELIATLDRDLEEARALQPAAEAPRPKVLFIYARGQGTLNVAGLDTSGAAMIALAGGQNAITGFEGYKGLTAEAVVEAAPDFILMSDMGAQSIGGADGVFSLPGMALTPAAKGRRLITLEDLLLLGFGPRTGEAVKQLSTALHVGGGAEGQHRSAAP